ncbi:MAG: hypothetical protein AB7H97_00670 [Pseudobdellovibrionaceae bacterium]
MSEEIPNPLMMAKSRFPHGDNFIPCGYRQWMDDNDRSVASLRAELISILITSLSDYREIFVSHVSSAFGSPYPPGDIRMSIQSCEICFDQVHRTGTQFVRIPKVVRGFNQAADSAEIGYFDGNGRFRARERLSAISRLTSFSEKDTIRAFVNEDGVWVEYYSYQKEDGPYGSLNRNEGRFNQTALEKIFGSRLFSSEQDLVKMIDRLSEITFNRFYPILSFSPTIKLKDWKRLRVILRNVLGGYAEEVYWQLRKHGQVSTTGMGNKIPRAVKSRIPMLARCEIVFQKRRRSTYGVSWKSLPCAAQRFLRFKQDQADHRKKQIGKSWATIKCDQFDEEFLQPPTVLSTRGF